MKEFGKLKKMKKILKDYLLQFFKFSIIGFFGIIINYVSFIISYLYFDIHYIISGAIGYLIPAIPGFYLNKIWTFQSNISMKKGVPLYFVIDGIKILVHILTQYTVTNFFHIDEIYSQGFGIVLAVLVGFILLKKLLNG